MKSLLLFLLILPSALPECIKWAKCNKATCFSKYAARNGLGLFDKIAQGAAPPTVGLSLEHTTAQDGTFTKTVTRVVVQVEIPGMGANDFAGIAVGKFTLVGCLKDKALPNMEFKAHSTTPAYAGNSFCCSIDVEHLNIELLAVSSALPLSIIYSSGGASTTLPTDFSIVMIMDALKRRETVTCDISPFRMEKELGEGITPYYPLQDPETGRCELKHQAIKKFIWGNFSKGKGGENVPICKEGKWTFKGEDIVIAQTSIYCVPQDRQMRIACAGHAPPAEIRCGRECGSMHADYFHCAPTTQLQVLDNSTTWRTAGKIMCTVDGFVSILGEKKTHLSIAAKVRCKVKNPHNPTVSFLTFSRGFAIGIAVLIYVILFTALAIGCNIFFTKWAERVELLGPIHSPYGALSSRAVKNNNNVTSNNNNTTNNNNESNRNTPSNRTNNTAESARSRKQ